ncbi:MAG: magnesium and cobalt exporter, family [Ilumatobacteraceae bacterium]|jgi:CBS domain containing-hemolysin-like protein
MIAFNNVDLLMLFTILFLLIVLIFTSIAEMGLSRITKTKAASMAEGGHKSARALQRLVSSPERWVNPLLLTINVCQTVQATLTGILSARLWGTYGVIAGVIANVLVFFVLAEAVPKTYAILHPQKAALATARATAALVAFPPLRMISRGLIGLTNVIVRGKGLEQGPFVSESELLGIVEVASQEGVVEHEERELIESIIEFGDTVAREVMVPRPDVVTLDDSSTVTQALDTAIGHGFSRLPVLGSGGEDDVVGIAYTKDLMQAERNGQGERPVTEFLRPARFVPEMKPVNRLMREMQADKFHLALVADEYGAFSGLITLEDCLEELVGEIVDEHDEDETEVQRLADGDYSVDGSMNIEDLNELLDTRIPDEDWETLAGFLFGTLEHVPEAGESLIREGWLFTVTEVEGRRIRRVEVSRDPSVDASSLEIDTR